MTKTTNDTPKKSLSMDMVPPYAVYVDGVEVATHPTEEQAEAHYAQLRVSHLGKGLPSMLERLHGGYGVLAKEVN